MPGSIAVCMIVKDESASLPRCLNSLAGLGARLYITDTGSRDNTREIAIAHGAEVREFPWVDDFSAARNHSISGVAEDWILTLDADDYFPPGEAARIPGYLEDESKVALALKHEIIEGSTPQLGLRLFRNHKGFRYTGVFHENLNESLKHFPPECVGVVPVLLKHTGYRLEHAERKLKRNLPLLTREWERCTKNGDRPQMLLVGNGLAECAFASGAHSRGEEILLNLLESILREGETYEKDWQIILLANLISHYHRVGREGDALKSCFRFEKAFGRHPVFWLYRGISRLRLRLFREAWEDFDRFDRSLEHTNPNLSIPIPLMGPELWNYEGICLAALGRPAEASSRFTKAVAAAPENPEYRARLKTALIAKIDGTKVGD